MNNIVTLSLQAKEIVNSLVENGGDLTPELEELLEVNSTALANKADNYYYLTKSLKSEVEYWKSQVAEVTKVVKSITNFEKQLKERVKYAMTAADLKEIQGVNTKWKLSEIKKKLIIENEEEVPEEYLDIISTTVPNKDRIFAALTLGKTVPGCKLEPNHMLRTSLNKKD